MTVGQGIWTCVSVTHVAGKEVIKASDDALRAQPLAQTASYHPVTLQMTPVARKAA